MKRIPFPSLLAVLLLLTPALPSAVAQEPAESQAPEQPESAKIWVGRAQEFEDYLRNAEVVRVEENPIGVTKPMRAYLAPGGLVESISWKTIKPGRHRGYWESYKSEIAAYELDKLLGMDMIPPTVEKRVNGELGAAVMWVRPVKSFKELGGPPTAPPIKFAAWNKLMIRAKMFDNLIGNKDPNLGNWLVDPAWNLILIDHTRAFTSDKEMVHKMTRIDREFWEKMKALTEETLTAAAGEWLDKGAIRATLARRDRLQTEIDKLVAANGEQAVYVQ